MTQPTMRTEANLDPKAHAANDALRFNGPDMAAVLAACIAIFALGAVQLWVVLDESGDNKELMQDIGNAWIPHAEHIGPYSGKETVMLVAWIASWGILYLALRHKHVDPRPWFGIGLVLLLIGVLGVWPPVWHALGAP
jgi:hypothetical protein